MKSKDICVLIFVAEPGRAAVRPGGCSSFFFKFCKTSENINKIILTKSSIVYMGFWNSHLGILAVSVCVAVLKMK